MLNKIKRKFKILSGKVMQYTRILFYRTVSNCENVQGNPNVHQPMQLVGNGLVSFGNNVHVGYFPSPYFYDGSIYIESRTTDSYIQFGDNVYINNNCTFIAENESIYIGSNTLIGTNCEIINSDFHDLDPLKRQNGNPKTAKVHIGENVFIGSNVKILKGVIIGNNSVIANGSTVTKSIPENCIAGGNPAKVIKLLEQKNAVN